jgi:hypothetical protein
VTTRAQRSSVRSATCDLVAAGRGAHVEQLDRCGGRLQVGGGEWRVGLLKSPVSKPAIRGVQMTGSALVVRVSSG